MSDTQNVLELRNVDKSFGPIDVLHKISLSVKAGEVLCLLGDNGAGKSTLIKTMAGCARPHPWRDPDGWQTGAPSAGRKEAQEAGNCLCAPIRRHLPPDVDWPQLLRRG